MFDTTQLSLSADEEAKYLSLVRDAKLTMKPESENVKRDFINKEVVKLVESGVDKVVARQQITMSLESSELYSHQQLQFQEHGIVTVAEVLADPAKFDNCTLADPFEPDYRKDDKSLAKFFADKLIIHSFVHGRKNYYLKGAPDVTAETWQSATQVSDSIEFMLLKALPSINVAEVSISVVAINKIVSLTLWDANKGKFYSLSKENVLNAYDKPSGFKLLSKVNGRVFDAEFVREFAQKEDMTKADINTLIKGCESQLLDCLVIHNQRSSIEMRVDMFARVPRIEMQADNARIVYIHKPYLVKGDMNEEILDDYKQHFPLVDDFISFIIASRFARDRKRSFLWFLCESDWGKGFLMGVLSELNASIELSIKEVEKMFEGGPVGRSMADFKNSLALVIDEFKTVKSEVKQLQSTITISPKNQFSVSVEIFVKLFFSAESVDSLVGDAGVEDQFVNRFSIFQLSGDLTKRGVYVRHGSACYFDTVLAYVATEFNSLISQYQALGQAGAEKKAEEYINEFVSRHGMGNTFKRLSESIDDIALTFASDIYEAATSGLYDNNDLADMAVLAPGDSLYLIKPAKAYEVWVKANYGQSERVMLQKKRKDIFECLSASGEGVKRQRVDGTPRDSIRVKDEIYVRIDSEGSVVRGVFG